MTLTPQDGDEIIRQCPAVADVSPMVRAGCKSSTATATGCRYINGVAPIYLKFSEWEDLEEGGMFTDTMSATPTRSACRRTTIRRELFQDESPIGKDLRMNNVAFKLVGVFTHKGANMMGMDQDDIVLAPWTTIKYRVSGTTLTNTNQCAAARPRCHRPSTRWATFIPPPPPMYPTAPAPRRPTRRSPSVRQRRPIFVKAASTEQIPQAIDEITQLLHERHRIKEEQADDFNIRDMSEIDNALSSTTTT